MAQVVISAAVAGATFVATGGNIAAASFAFGATSSLLGAYAAAKQRGDGPRIGDSQITNANYGEPLPYVIGAGRVAGSVEWQSEKRATTTEQDGKGGGPTATSTSYDCDVLFGLTSNPKEAVTRIWLNGKLVFSALPGADDETLENSQNSDLWSRLTFYSGAEDQLPDPTYEAAVGSANAPAYRGRATIFIEGLQLGQSGQLPNFTFELSKGVETERAVLLLNFEDGFKDAATEQVFVSDGAAPGIEIAGDGKFGSALNANGTDPGGGGSRRLKSAAARSDWDLNGGDFTIEGWVRCDSKPIRPRYVVGIHAGGGDVEYSLTVGSTGSAGQIRIGALWATGVSNIFELQRDITDTRDWFHVAFMRLANKYTIFVNGVSLGSGTSSYRRPAGSKDVYSGGLSGTSDAHHGRMDGIRVCKDAIYPETGFTLPSSAPSLYYQMPGAEIQLDTLRGTAEALCLRANMPAGTYDASALASITRPVRSMVIGQIGATRATLEQLMTAFSFKASASDKLYFAPIPTSPVETITFDEIGCGSENPQSEALPLTVDSELEIPPQVVVRYPNVTDDYQAGTEPSARLLRGQASLQTVDLAVGMTPSEAKAVADVTLIDALAGIVTGSVSLGMRHAKLEPGDVVLIEREEGEDPMRFRLGRRSDAQGVISFDIRGDDASALVSAGITDEDYTPSATVTRSSPSSMLALDMPLLRDADNGPGYYVAAKPTGTTWPGAQVFSSVNDVDFASVATVSERAVFGVTTSILPAFTGGWVMDEVSRVTVNMGDGELASSTRDAMFADEQINAMLIGSEVVRFVTATLDSASPNIYTLSRFFRGQKGTEWAQSTHANGERAVLLRPRGIRPITTQQSDVGALRYLKAVTSGKTLSSADSQTFTNTGISQKPLAPVDIRASRAGVGGPVTVRWRRRSRLSAVLFGAVPLGESTEQYRVRVFSGSTAIRTATVTSETWEYTSAMQSADATSFNATLDIEVCQISATVGVGYAGRSNVSVGTGVSGLGTFAGIIEEPLLASQAGSVLVVSAGDDQTIYSSADGGETFTASAENGIVSYPSVQQRASLGDIIAAYSHNMAAAGTYAAVVGDIAPLAAPTYYLNDVNDTNPATSGIIPRINSTNVGLYTCCLASDGTKFYLIAYTAQSGTLQPGGDATLYESTDGINYTSVGAVAADPSDPNPGEAGTTEFLRQVGNSNPSAPILRKIGTRWFLMGVEATYYNDSTAPQTGWLRCVVTDKPQTQFRGIADMGSSTFLAYGGTWNGGGQVGGVYLSTNSGATWTAVAAASTADQMGAFQMPMMEAHKVSSGTLRAWLGQISTLGATPQVIQCASPYTSYSLEPATFSGSGTPTRIFDAMLTSTGYVATAENISGGVLTRKPWLVWTADGINFQDSEIL